MGSPGAIQGSGLYNPTLAILSLTSIPHLGHHFFVNVRSNELSLNYFNIQVAR